MSTHKHIDKICVIAVVVCLIITVIFINGSAFGIQAALRPMGYEERLFDTSRVHTIDIVMDDWDDFIETCTSEEYSMCAVVIDGESYKNVGIRAKGNTSLSTVASMNSNRYSFKIEFDHYDSSKSYYGLDKLSLNNTIQDTTYMKDYLTYRLMDSFGVDAPLCSYVYITVNGEDWGLYLAVEGVEDTFLQRNYGKNHGELYKPDSLSFGGGRGNGRDFNMEDFFNSSDEDTDFSNFGDFGNFGGFGGFGNMGGQGFGGQSIPDTGDETESQGGFDPSTMFGDGMQGDMPQGGDMAGMPDVESPENFGGRNMPKGEIPQGQDAQTGEIPQGFDMQDIPNAGMEEGFDRSQMFGGGNSLPNMSEDVTNSFDRSNMFGGGNMGGGMSMGSSDVKLQYIDDDPDSYSNIFDNAKTKITDADKLRLIESLKQLSEGVDIESVVDIDEVLRYFVVHNFVVNGDSYTGSMIHNYYLYEEDGKLSMIPWDYNLAFGTFQGNSASSAVNDPIDTPLSVTGNGDRPIIDWIFSSEEYTGLYHEYFAEFIENTDFAELIDETYDLIADYVKKDPTAFYSYEDFENGVAVLKSFCELRAESIKGQLDGTIPSTDAGQTADSSSLINASGLNLSDMGSMNNGMGEMGNRGNLSSDDRSDRFSGMTDNMPNENPDATPSASDGQGKKQSFENMGGDDSRSFGGMQLGQNFGNSAESQNSSETVALLVISIAVLLTGLLAAFMFRRQKR